MQRTRQQRQTAHDAQYPHQQDIFHESGPGELSETVKDVPPQEDTLISKRNSCAADAERIAGFKTPEYDTALFNALTEGTPGNVRRSERMLHLKLCLWREPAVGMQKEQGISGRPFRTEILLDSAPGL